MKRLLPLIAILVLAGCGSSGKGGTKTIVQIQTVTTPPAQTQTVPDVNLPPPTQTTQTPQAPQPPQGTLRQARQKISELGYDVDDPGDYDSGATLRVLIGTRHDSGDGYAKRAFFFAGGHYLGTDTSDDSAGIRVERQTDTTVTLAYALYGRSDALCCPSGTATVRYEWNGSKLTPLDPIPPQAKRG